MTIKKHSYTYSESENILVNVLAVAVNIKDPLQPDKGHMFLSFLGIRLFHSDQNLNP